MEMEASFVLLAVGGAAGACGGGEGLRFPFPELEVAGTDDFSSLTFLLSFLESRPFSL